MKNIFSALSAAGLLFVAGSGYAAPGDVGIGVTAGTPGVGLEASLDLSENFGLRGNINYLKYDFNATISDIDYTFEPEWFNGALLLDWYPFTNAFRLTAGAYLNGNEVSVEGTYREDLLPPEYSQYADLVNLAKIKGTADFNTFAPYLGIGWTSNQHDRGWGVSLDLGVMFQGAATVSELYVEDPWGLGSHPVVTEFLEGEQKAIQDELDKFEYYPVASISVNYRF